MFITSGCYGQKSFLRIKILLPVLKMSYVLFIVFQVKNKVTYMSLLGTKMSFPVLKTSYLYCS